MHIDGSMKAKSHPVDESKQAHVSFSSGGGL